MIRISASLQFSRNPKVAEHKSISLGFASPPELQFSRNPKVAEHRWRVWRFIAARPKLQFSRNPKVAEHDFEPRLWAGDGLQLQFSRNPKVAEHASRESLRAIARALQFSRNPKVAEHLTTGATAPPPFLASIQPQPKSCGTLPLTVPGRDQVRRGFNSAATQKLRNTEHSAPAATARWPARLQFSRNPKVAEHVVELGGFSLAWHASIQPQPKSCGTRCSACGSATMGVGSLQFSPQPKSCGTLGALAGKALPDAALQFSRNCGESAQLDTSPTRCGG